ncbi:MAG TPA: hypothetical protein VNU26_18855 [Mycobacteriales bacterium]|nr:hypothetical protein [Mycobacteriales bacterium]
MAARDHPTALRLLAHASGADDAADDVAEHVAVCALCLSRLARLDGRCDDTPSAERVAALAAASSELPAEAVAAARLPDPAEAPAPAPGELWRAGRETATLVWIRKLLDGAVAAVPVVLDTELADDESLIVAAPHSPLGEELALLVGAETHIDPAALINRVGPLDAGDQVEAIRTARRHGTAAAGVTLGAPIVSAFDQRIEHRQAVADELMDLAPGTFDGVATADEPSHGPDMLSLAAELAELPTQRPGCQPSDTPLRIVPVDGRHSLLLTAQVRELDLLVLVAVLTGPDAGRLLTDNAVAEACAVLLTARPDADDVAVAVDDGEWTAVVVAAAYTAAAWETPAGSLSRPRVQPEPLPLRWALGKHFDSHAGPSATDPPVRLDAAVPDVQALVADAARDAVAAVAAKGSRAVTAEKKAAYATLGVDDAATIADLLRAAVAGDDPDAAVSLVLGGAG